MKKNKPFTIPEDFLAKLQEFTKGYVLIFVDTDDSIQCIFNPASETSYLSLPEKMIQLGNHMRMERDTGDFGDEAEV